MLLTIVAALMMDTTPKVETINVPVEVINRIDTIRVTKLLYSNEKNVVLRDSAKYIVHSKAPVVGRSEAGVPIPGKPIKIIKREALLLSTKKLIQEESIIGAFDD